MVWQNKLTRIKSRPVHRNCVNPIHRHLFLSYESAFNCTKDAQMWPISCQYDKEKEERKKKEKEENLKFSSSAKRLIGLGWFTEGRKGCVMRRKAVEETEDLEKEKKEGNRGKKSSERGKR